VTAERIGVAARFFVLAGGTLLVVALCGTVLDQPLLTATLGPTAYVLLAHPESEGARLRNSIVGHAAGVGSGLVALAALGLWHALPVAPGRPVTLRQAGAAALAVGLTLVLLDVTRSHHAPAAASALLVATSHARPGAPLTGLVVGLVVTIAVAGALARFPVLRRESVREP
jgi:hypothetical protein